MTMLNLNLENVEVSSGISVVPTGVYNVKITSAIPKENKSKTGGYLETVFTILDGDHQGKAVVNRYNIQNTNEDTVKYALRDIKTILTVGGHNNPNLLKDTDEMLGLQLRISLEETLQMKDGAPVTDDNGKPYRQNNFKGYFKFEEGVTSTSNDPINTDAEKASTPTAAQAAQPQQEAPAPTPEANGAFPWS